MDAFGKWGYDWLFESAEGVWEDFFGEHGENGRTQGPNSTGSTSWEKKEKSNYVIQMNLFKRNCCNL